MNIFLIISGIVALFIVVGHFTMGRKTYLLPMMEASFDGVAKKVMQSVFHYSSVNLVLMAVMLLALGFGVNLKGASSLIVQFIALHYSLFAAVLIITALASKIEKPMFKMFQWILFIIVAVLAWLGAA
ncbi:MAG TPA: hypothetical protein ENI15_15445 [Spirochaetes bacterium]|nr:hypothetical protein [Spirochaetota bacterium]